MAVLLPPPACCHGQLPTSPLPKVYLLYIAFYSQNDYYLFIYYQQNQGYGNYHFLEECFKERNEYTFTIHTFLTRVIV